MSCVATEAIDREAKWWRWVVVVVGVRVAAKAKAKAKQKRGGEERGAERIRKEQDGGLYTGSQALVALPDPWYRYLVHGAAQVARLAKDDMSRLWLEMQHTP